MFYSTFGNKINDALVNSDMQSDIIHKDNKVSFYLGSLSHSPDII